MREGHTDDCWICWTEGIEVKRNWVVSCIMTAEVALLVGQLEFKLLIAGHFTCSTLAHSIHRRKTSTCLRMNYVIWSVSE